MKTVTLPLKKKIVGLKAKTVSGVSAAELDADDYAPGAQQAQPPQSAGEQGDKRLKELQKQIEILETSLQKAREEAFEAGVEDGRERAKLDFQKTEDRYKREYNDLVCSLKGEFDRTIQSMEEPLLYFAFKIAERVIERELKYPEDYRELFQKQIKTYLSELVNQGHITIQLNPAQLNQISSGDFTDQLALPKEMNLHLIENESLAPGECIIETKDLKIDGTIARLLENVKKEVIDNEWMS